MRHRAAQPGDRPRPWVKHENHNPTSAFKVRGGLNLVRSLSPDERRRGVVTASTGNHGQSIALACQREGVPCTVFVPDGNNPDKNAAMRAFGATLIEGGRDFDEARERCEQRPATTGARYVHSANEPLLIAGVATYALEIFEQLPDVDVDLRADRRRQRRVRDWPGAQGARRAAQGDRRAGGAGRRLHAIVARARAWSAIRRRHVRRRDGDARHLRLHVRDPRAASSNDIVS